MDETRRSTPEMTQVRGWNLPAERKTWFGLLAALVVAGLAALPATGAAAGQPLVYALSLAPEGFPALCSEGPDGAPRFALPQFELYDRAGRATWRVAGYPGDFRRRLARKVRRGRPIEAAEPLEALLPRFVAVDGRRAASELLAATEITMVQYWAEWCLPCKRQLADLRRYLEAKSGLDVKLLLVEADPRQLSERDQSLARCGGEGDAATRPQQAASAPPSASSNLDDCQRALRRGERSEVAAGLRDLEAREICSPASLRAVAALVAATGGDAEGAQAGAEDVLRLAGAGAAAWQLNDLAVALARLPDAGREILELAEGLLRLARAREELEAANVDHNLIAVLEELGRAEEARALERELPEDRPFDPGLAILGDFAMPGRTEG